jgi:N-succinyldiaminopimelate aminotransferase
MNPNLAKLQSYPFEKLAELKSSVRPSSLSAINLSIGEPKHPAPALVNEAITKHLNGLSTYPTTSGSLELRQAISGWATKRFRLQEGSLDPDKNVLPVNGTREAIFAFAQCLVAPSPDALVLMPNPFYQIYEGAALLAGAAPYYINATKATAFLPDFNSVPTEIWRKCQLLYLCSPGNPTGAVCDLEALKQLISLSEQYGFVIGSDECYSEIYLDGKPPVGLLEACSKVGLNDYKRCLVFHSLSKRTSVPGMRSGFVAGDAELIDRFRLYRTYHGSAMSPMVQAASTAAWQDERHVIENRKLYQLKFDQVLAILAGEASIQRPDGAFYLWLETPDDDTRFAQRLFESYNVTVLPGSYMSREAHGINPGANHVRIALVDSVEVCNEAALRLRDFLRSYK